MSQRAEAIPARPTRGALAPYRLAGLAGKALTYLLLIGGSVLFVVPFLWMVRTSLMAVDKMFVYPPQVIPDPVVWQNYADMWRTGPIVSWIRNSLIVTLTSMLGETLTSILVAYGFARARFPGRNRLFVFVLATIMIP